MKCEFGPGLYCQIHTTFATKFVRFQANIREQIHQSCHMRTVVVLENPAATLLIMWDLAVVKNRLQAYISEIGLSFEWIPVRREQGIEVVAVSKVFKEALTIGFYSPIVLYCIINMFERCKMVIDGHTFFANELAIVQSYVGISRCQCFVVRVLIIM